VSAAAAARRPAATGAVARHYLWLLARERGVSAFLLPLVAMIAGMNLDGFASVGLMISLAFFYPLYQWRGGARETLDPAMPLDAARHRRVRVTCGAAWAALGLATWVGLYTWLFVSVRHGLAGFPAWYPVALLGWGVASYLFGAATWLRAERPGRTLVLVFFAAGTALEWLPGPWANAALGQVEPAVLNAKPWPAWAAACLLTLALAWAAVWVAASPAPWLPRLRALLPLGHRAHGGEHEGPSAAPAPARAIAAGPRRPATAAMVLRRELAMVGHDARWALLVVALMAVQAMAPDADISATLAQRLPWGGRTAVLVTFAWMSFFWPILVWIDERGPGRELAESIPAGMLKRRLLHLLAGAAWLELLALVALAGVTAGAWRAGLVASPADVPAAIWAGFPIGALMMYLIGSLPHLSSSRSPVRSEVVWFLAFTLVLAPPLLLSSGWTLSPGAAFSVTTLQPPPHWGEAVLIWLPLLVAAAVGAIAAGVSSDRDGDPHARLLAA
jgi:hypothetical protein